MFISTKVSVSFHPVNEYEQIQEFMETNDMNEWRTIQSTVAITFVSERTFFIDKKVKDGEIH